QPGAGSRRRRRLRPQGQVEQPQQEPEERPGIVTARKLSPDREGPRAFLPSAHPGRDLTELDIVRDLADTAEDDGRAGAFEESRTLRPKLMDQKGERLRHRAHHRAVAGAGELLHEGFEPGGTAVPPR